MKSPRRYDPTPRPGESPVVLLTARVQEQPAARTELAAQVPDVASGRRARRRRPPRGVRSRSRRRRPRSARPALPLAGAPQQRLDASEQLLPPKRLRHVIVGSRLQAADLLQLHAARRQHHDRHLGHEPYVCDTETGAPPLPDVFLFEPAAAKYLELAASLRRRDPELPLVLCSIQPPTAETRALRPVRHLLKPFVRADLAAAVEQAARAGAAR